MIAFITVGISASGKTTWAEKVVASYPGNWVNINRDDIRFGIIGVRDSTKWSFTKENEKKVTNIQSQMMDNALVSGRNIIISDTNINDKVRNKLVTHLYDMGYEVHLVWFDIDLREAILRDSKRTNPVKPRIINEQYLRYQYLCQRTPLRAGPEHYPLPTT